MNVFQTLEPYFKSGQTNIISLIQLLLCFFLEGLMTAESFVTELYSVFLKFIYCVFRQCVIHVLTLEENNCMIYNRRFHNGQCQYV